MYFLCIYILANILKKFITMLVSLNTLAVTLPKTTNNILEILKLYSLKENS